MSAVEAKTQSHKRVSMSALAEFPRITPFLWFDNNAEDAVKFGLSWQIVPARLPDLIKKPGAMQAMLKMKKLDIAELESAAKA